MVSERFKGKGGDNESKETGKEPSDSEDEEIQYTSEDQSKLNVTEEIGDAGRPKTTEYNNFPAT